MNSTQSKGSNEPSQDKGPQAMSDHFDFGLPPDRRQYPARIARPPQGRERTPWRQELSERVLSFRQRRARLRNEPPEEATLDFEFERSEASAPGEQEVEKILEFPQDTVSIDAEIAPLAEVEEDERQAGAATQDGGEEGFEIFDSAQPRADEFAVEPLPPADNHLEIVLGPSEVGAPGPATPLGLEAFPVAPLGRRFLAGLADGVVLLLGGAIFTLIFRFAGGHLTPVPPNFAIVAVIVTIFVWSYFGMFTALTFSTPGQTWMAIEVRTMEGWPPTPRESLLRAFGYVVSLSAFMIGFFWALVDSESLTWHDRISGTFLTPKGRGPLVEGMESKTQRGA